MSKSKHMVIRIPEITIEKRIYMFRGRKVMVDSDLAEPYGVETKSLNLAVRRNSSRFPLDFMFQATPEETKSLRFQIETSNNGGRGGRRYSPYLFTEQGIAMLSSILKSERAIQVNIQIMRTFTKLSKMLMNNTSLRRKIMSMERKYDRQFKVVFDAIRGILEPPKKPERRVIGFQPR